MTDRTIYTVACLSGHGIGPEVMAQASRALDRVSRLHGFRVAEIHLPFGAEALTQSGHALPGETRRATLEAQAILVAAGNEPALAGVESELDLRTRVDRVAYGARSTVTVLSPLGDGAASGALQRAFELARSSKGQVTSVGGDSTWKTAVEAEAALHAGVLVEFSTLKVAASRLAFEPDAFDVVVTPAPYAEPLVALVAHGHHPRVVASGRLAASGPAVFLPAHGAAEDIAGQGVANPASMLLAAALLLGEGLGERRAAETLTGAVLHACSNGTRTPDMVSTGVGATTREFTDVVLSELPGSLTNAEFYREAVA
ncbi:MAG TPA: isocitrate/isopropylmalate family dehydrogenase [Gaiellaceae bacterium]|nr:isocitrate/isopropylmalate family dehydrogenase [Gaiellaceae bacterium]